MKTRLERAATLIEQQYKRNPEAVQLAKLASLAVRVEPHLLRRLRLELLRDADVGIEADLWFGPLVESRGVRAIVLNRYVVELLREKLAEDRQLLWRVIALTKQAHAEAATTIRLEERLTALAVLNEPDAPEKIDEALRPALRTMQVGGEDARQLAQWAMRALSQAHHRVRESRNAIDLGFSAALALGGRPILKDVPKSLGDLSDISWLLQVAISAPPTRIGVELVPDGVAFAEPGGGQPQLELPATNPLVLSLAWKTDGGDAQMLVEAVPGRTVELNADVTHVQLRTLSGDEYLLSAVSPVESSPQATSEDVRASHFDIDVFISYAHLDNQPLLEGEGWVDMLHKSLKAFLSSATGREVTIWRDLKLSGADVFSNEIVTQFSKTAVMLLIVTPRYLRSESCIKEVNDFCQVAEQTGRVLVDNKSRVVKVMLEPIGPEHTQRLPPSLRDTLGYVFFETTERGRLIRLDPRLGEEFKARFYREVSQLADHVAEMLSRLRGEPLPQPPAKKFSGIFINYRREDATYVGRLYDRLIQRFGEDQVFMDIDQIEPGEDFVDVINRKVAACDIAIVAIGPHWLSATDASGKRRLDDEADFVRMEIVAALQHDIRVIPVLVGGARMPGRHDLPEALAPLSRRNAIELSETRFQADVNRLIEAIEKSLPAKQFSGVAPGTNLKIPPREPIMPESIDPTMDELRRKRAELEAQAEHLNKQLEQQEQLLFQNQPLEETELRDQQELQHRLAAVHQSIMSIDAELRSRQSAGATDAGPDEIQRREEQEKERAEERRVRLNLETLHSPAGAVVTGAGPYTLRQLMPQWRAFQTSLIESLNLGRSGANLELAEKVSDAFEIDILSIFVGAWNPAISTTLHESKKTSAAFILELSEHNIASEHHPSIDTKIKNVTVGRIVLNVRLSFRLKGFVLKIQNGMISEIQTGTCELDCRIIFNDLVIAEMERTPIKLPPSISVAGERWSDVRTA